MLSKDLITNVFWIGVIFFGIVYVWLALMLLKMKVVKISGKLHICRKWKSIPSGRSLIFKGFGFDKYNDKYVLAETWKAHEEMPEWLAKFGRGKPAIIAISEMGEEEEFLVYGLEKGEMFQKP